jgi:hypothetical protein
VTAPAEDRMLGRIRKLLAMAEADGLTEAARDSYNAKAAELIAQYGIDQVLLAAHAPMSAAPVDRTIELLAPYARDKADLLWAVLEPLRCKGVRTIRSRTGRVEMRVFGMPADLERAEVLFTSLLVQVAHGTAVAYPDDPMESIAAYRRSWIMGFRVAIHRRLMETERHATEQATSAETTVAGTPARSVALVLVEQKDRVEQAVHAAYPKLKKAKPRSLAGTGYQDGAAAGRRADLGGTRLGGQRRRAVGR